MKPLATLAATTTLVLMLAAPSIAETGSNRSSSNPCDNFSYLYTEDGRCIDLSYMTGPVEPFLVFQFRTALQNLGVSLYKIYCRDEVGKIKFGYYDPKMNKMVLCINNTGDNSPQMIQTLVHESWHTVQDCKDGLRNQTIVAILEDLSSSSLAIKILQDFNMLLNVLNVLKIDDRTDILTLYPDEKMLEEAEARLVQDRPDIVLQGLINRCSP